LFLKGFANIVGRVPSATRQVNHGGANLIALSIRESSSSC
jgi:hypothetical protein